MKLCLLKKLVEFTEELVQSIAKGGLCYLLTPSSASFVNQNILVWTAVALVMEKKESLISVSVPWR